MVKEFIEQFGEPPLCSSMNSKTTLNSLVTHHFAVAFENVEAAFKWLKNSSSNSLVTHHFAVAFEDVEAVFAVEEVEAAMEDQRTCLVWSYLVLVASEELQQSTTADLPRQHHYLVGLRDSPFWGNSPFWGDSPFRDSPFSCVTTGDWNTNGGNLEKNGGHLVNTNGGHLVYTNGGHLVNTNGGHIVNTNVGHFLNRSVGHLVNTNSGHIVNRSVGHLVYTNGGHLVNYY